MLGLAGLLPLLLLWKEYCQGKRAVGKGVVNRNATNELVLVGDAMHNLKLDIYHALCRWWFWCCLTASTFRSGWPFRWQKMTYSHNA